jgi:V8-like Glu-specific endopeptidase
MSAVRCLPVKEVDRMSHRATRCLLGALVLAGAVLAAPTAAHAQEISPLTPVSSAVAGKGANTYWTPQRMRTAVDADVLAPPAAATANTPVAPITEVHRVKPATPKPGTVRPSIAATSSIGRIFFSVNGGNYACSGSSVNSDSGQLVLTAGHCVFDVSSRQWASNFVYIPGYNGGAPYGQWNAAVLTTFAGFTQGDGRLDTAFVVVTGPGKLRDTVGANGISTGYTSFDGPLLTMGYPPNSPNNQYYCQATATIDVNQGYVFMPCSQGPGASGSPILQDFNDSIGLGTNVSDLTLLITSGNTTSNAGPIFTDATWNLYQSVQGTTA